MITGRHAVEPWRPRRTARVTRCTFLLATTALSKDMHCTESQAANGEIGPSGAIVAGTAGVARRVGIGTSRRRQASEAPPARRETRPSSPRATSSPASSAWTASGPRGKSGSPVRQRAARDCSGASATIPCRPTSAGALPSAVGKSTGLATASLPTRIRNALSPFLSRDVC